MVISKTICVTISSSDRICLLIVFNIFSYLRWNVRLYYLLLHQFLILVVVVSSSSSNKKKVWCHSLIDNITHEFLVNDEC